MFNGVNFSNALSPASWNEVSGEGGGGGKYDISSENLYLVTPQFIPWKHKTKDTRKKIQSAMSHKKPKTGRNSSEAFWGYSWCILNIDFEMKHYKIEVFQDIECIFDSKAPLWREGQPQITSKCASIYLNNIQQGLYEHFASFKG